jgi:hypothetical protein
MRSRNLTYAFSIHLHVLLTTYWKRIIIIHDSSQKVSGSNFGQKTDYPDILFLRLSQMMANHHNIFRDHLISIFFKLFIISDDCNHFEMASAVEDVLLFKYKTNRPISYTSTSV